MKNVLLDKETFNIKDLSKIVKKESQTIRSWEEKGIINRPPRKTDKKQEWREYTKEDLAKALEDILNHPWQREVIKNKDEIQYIINYLRGNVNDNTLSLMGENND